MLQMPVLILLIFFFCNTPLFFAQVVNIENKRINDGSYGLSGALDMTLATFQQDDLLVTFTFKPLIQYKFGRKKNIASQKEQEESDDPDFLPLMLNSKNKHLLLLVNDLKYSASKVETFANFGMSHLRYAYRIGESIWKAESYIQVQYNQLLLERIRVLTGGGLRAKFIDKTTQKKDGSTSEFRLFVGSSLFYEYQEINHAERSIEYINTLRWNTYLSTYFHFKTIEFTSSTYFQPNISSSIADHRILGDYALLVQISEPFRIKMNVSYFYDSRPAPTVASSMLSMSLGFVYHLNRHKK